MLKNRPSLSNLFTPLLKKRNVSDYKLVDQNELKWKSQKLLGTDTIRPKVQMPQDQFMSLPEWWALNTVDFLNQLYLLVGVISDICTEASCPVMCAGTQQIAWTEDAYSRPTTVSAPLYMENLLAWIESQLENPVLFPPDGSFAPKFRQVIQIIYTRIFHFYAHIYFHHVQDLRRMGEESHMNTCFSHFIVFCDEYDLLDPKDTKILSPLMRQVLERNPRIQ
ncbi:Mob1/phocein [Gorgonomyces haynaldii]|nr:Mob1/phocein [Gorgonomyces haynaldii]